MLLRVLEYIEKRDLFDEGDEKQLITVALGLGRCAKELGFTAPAKEELFVRGFAHLHRTALLMKDRIDLEDMSALCIVWSLLFGVDSPFFAESARTVASKLLSGVETFRSVDNFVNLWLTAVRFFRASKEEDSVRVLGRALDAHYQLHPELQKQVLSSPIEEYLFTHATEIGYRRMQAEG